jgi:hypothetical protein
MDASSETIYALLGIGVSESYPAQFLSSHALLQEQSSQDCSRRMLFPLKTDNFIRKKKKNEEEEEECVCENIEIGLR